MLSVENYTGALWDAERDITTIAKIIRAKIREAVASGALPKYDYRVKAKRMIGGRSLYVGVFASGLPFRDETTCKWNPEWERIHDMIHTWMREYNYDHGDPSRDRYDCGFYGSVSLNPAQW